MELRHLRYFLAVAEQRHFGRAAEQLHMAGPPVSRAIRQLEDELGVELFLRTTRQVELTPAGEVLRRDAEVLLASLDDTIDRVRRTDEGTLGIVRLGVTGSASYGVLPALARVVTSRLPGVSLQIRTEMLTPVQATALLERRLDLGVLRPPIPVDGLGTRVLHSEPLVLVLPEGHRFVGIPDLTVADLRSEPFVTYDATSSAVDPAVQRTCAAAGFVPRREHQVRETATLLALVAAGLGVALVPASSRVVALPGLHFVDLPDTETVDLALAWRADDRSALLTTVLDVLADADLPRLLADNDIVSRRVVEVASGDRRATAPDPYPRTAPAGALDTAPAGALDTAPAGALDSEGPERV